MQKILLFIFLSAYLTSVAQGTAGIYKFRWTIDSRLRNRVVINNAGDRNQNNIPTHLYDSVVNRVRKIVASELHTDTHYLYSLDKKGRERRMANTSDQIGGLPRGTKRQAMGTEYLEYYVKFKIRVDLNKTVSFGTEVASYSRLKPYVRVKMKAYGVDRRLKERKSSRTGGFKSIGSFNINVGGTTVTNTETPPIEEVLDMVFKGLIKFEEKVR